MNLKGFLFGLLGLQALAKGQELPESNNKTQQGSSSLYTEIGEPQIKRLVSMVNSARSNVRVQAYAMPKVTWNYQLENDLKIAVKTMPEDFWFGGQHAPGARYASQWLMRYAPFNTSYPDYDFMMHDGCQSTQNGVSRIFWMRAINQAKFFKYHMCADTVQPSNWGYINSYFSCAGINRNVTKLVSNEPWSWMWQYYPKIVNDDMDNFACMLLGRSGPNAAGGNRPNHFFCYWGHKSHPQTTEKPYVAIKDGQKAGDGCPGKAVNRLCV